jgi:hypothetical protein
MSGIFWVLKSNKTCHSFSSRTTECSTPSVASGGRCRSLSACRGSRPRSSTPYPRGKGRSRREVIYRLFLYPPDKQPTTSIRLSANKFYFLNRLFNSNHRKDWYLIFLPKHYTDSPNDLN